jgi:hypothetical protein
MYWMCVLMWSRTDKNIKKREEAASKKLIARTTKQCPGCKGNIEKSHGCDHMSCKISDPTALFYCDVFHTQSQSNLYLQIANADVCTGTMCYVEFCWQCLALYTNLQCTHHRECDYYSRIEEGVDIFPL